MPAFDVRRWLGSGWASGGQMVAGFAVRLAAPMDAQPKSRAAVDPKRNAELLRGVLAESEHLLRRQARRHAELREDAEDALQSAYVFFIERFRGDCDPLAWLFTTVKREAWALRRKPARRRDTSLDSAGGSLDDEQSWVEAFPSDVQTPYERAARNEELASRRAQIRALKPDQRRALGLLGVGLSYAEIRAVTGWTYTKMEGQPAGLAMLLFARSGSEDLDASGANSPPVIV